jgi:phospholipid/cholesterol/gamma-HCH transport system substrate-binding protein
MRRQVRSVFAATVGGLLLSSCAALNVSSVPLPGSSYQGGYDIVGEFENVLNLPDRARVVMDGTKVGVVTNVSLTGGHVNVTARVDRRVVVPSNTHAILQQATVLGDTYLALERMPETAPPLGSGGRIPLTQTTSPPSLEDTIAKMANFLGSGSIQRAQSTMISINRVTPPKGEVRRVVSQMTTDLEDLSNNINNVDLIINGAADTADVLAAGTPELSANLSPEGIRALKRNTVLASKIGTLLPSIGTVYAGGYWLIPAFNSIAGALDAIVGAKRVVEEEYPAYLHLLTKYFLPEDKYPAINITSIIGPDGRELSGNVTQVLRMLGAVP